MKALSLLYHDIVEPGFYDSSGFQGSGAARYKLDVNVFEQHLRAIAMVRSSPAATVFDPIQSVAEPPLYLTFDDGGISALRIAELLESFGWRGHFFIATDNIGAKTFLSGHEIQTLRKRGHVIGTHTCSHPEQISRRSRKEVSDEWEKSVNILNDMLGEIVAVASVPGGFYSRRVAETAGDCGIKTLFTSEPIVQTTYINGCLVLGRYSFHRKTTPEAAADIVAGRRFARSGQWALWNLKKAAKMIGGQVYLRSRKYLLSHAGDSNQDRLD